jgi:hypothetical protein
MSEFDTVIVDPPRLAHFRNVFCPIFVAYIVLAGMSGITVNITSGRGSVDDQTVAKSRHNHGRRIGVEDQAQEFFPFTDPSFGLKFVGDIASGYNKPAATGRIVANSVNISVCDADDHRLLIRVRSDSNIGKPFPLLAVRISVETTPRPFLQQIFPGETGFQQVGHGLKHFGVPRVELYETSIVVENRHALVNGFKGFHQQVMRFRS